MRLYTLAAILAILTAPVAAEQANQLKLNPGLVQADSAIYFLDTAEERASTMIGLRSEGSVAYEKASEIAVARQRNQTKAAGRAEKRLNEVAMAATNESYIGLKKAEMVLTQVQEQTPDEADEGLSTALQQIQEAQNRQPKKGGLFDGIPKSRAGNRTGQPGGTPDNGDRSGSDRRGR